MYQNTVNQVPTERSHAQNLHWDSVQEVEAVLREKYTSLPTSFSRSIYFPNLLSDSVNSAKCDSTRQISGGFYEPNVQPSDDPIVINEECVDLDRFLNAASSDERSTAEIVDSASAAAIRNKEKAIVADTRANDLGPHIYNNTISSNYLRYADPPMNPLVTLNNLKDIDKNGNNNTKNINSNEEYMTMDVIDNNSNIHSGYTSACTSPSNVLSMEGSPCGEYFLLNGTEVSTDYTLNDGFLESLSSFMKEEEKPSNVYTPDNSNESPYNGDFPSFKNNNNITTNNNTKRNNFPQLVLNLKDNYYNNDEINTPNIIDTIIASEHPMPYDVNVKDEIHKEPLFFTNTKLEELTPCPSTSPPAVVSDNTDSFLAAITDSPPAIVAKKRGRPRKRRRISEDSVGYDDLNDETYVPRSSQAIRRTPRTPRAVATKQIIYEDVSDDDDYKSTIASEEVANRLTPLYDATDDEVIRVGKRGRPPKHARSISSDDYSQLDPDEAKYREMRDRNNEASRKSRFKRKHKEMRLSDECQDLEMENIKLKAQVEELQKTVERYRDNLMQVMLNKK